MSVPFLDLSRQHAPLRPQIDAALARVLDSGQYILGAEAQGLEQELAARCGVAHGVSVASGTDAILLALLALDVGPGDEVITTPFTFMATGGSIARSGARPVFADIDPATFNLDPAATEAAITPRTRAVVAVDLYGQCAAWERFEALATARGIHLVEDACQAVGAGRGGRPAGSFGAAAAFSFYPTKNLGGMGDGGLLTTGSEKIAARVRRLRTHGDAGGYDHREIGMNSRMDAFQAAILRVKLAHLDAWNEERGRLAERYEEAFTHLLGPRGPGAPVRLPAPPGRGCIHVYHQYVVRAERRNDLMAHMRKAGIGCAVYYPRPLHLQPCFEGLGYRPGAFPEAERAAREALALPIYPGLSRSEQEEVVAAVAAFYGVKR